MVDLFIVFCFFFCFLFLLSRLNCVFFFRSKLLYHDNVRSIYNGPSLLYLLTWLPNHNEVWSVCCPTRNFASVTVMSGMIRSELGDGDTGEASKYG